MQKYYDNSNACNERYKYQYQGSIFLQEVVVSVALSLLLLGSLEMQFVDNSKYGALGMVNNTLPFFVNV